MASIGESHVFSTFENRKGKITNYLPVVEGPSKNIILTTTGSNTVELINKDDRRASQSWSTTLNDQFTSPAVCNYLAGHLAAIQQGRVLIQWNPDTDNIEESSKVNLPFPVRYLLPMQDSEPLIVFVNGQMALISYCTERETYENQGFLKLNETIVWANSAIHDGVVQATLVIKNEEDNAISTYFATISSSTNQLLSSQRNDISSQKVKLVSCCSQKATATVLTLWSNGEVKLHAVNTDQHVLHLPTSVKWMAIETVNKSHVVAAGMHAESGESMLEVWDFKFRVKKASRTMTHNLSSENCQMRMIDEALYVVCGNKIMQVPLSVVTSSLAIAVGKLRHGDEHPAKSSKMLWTVGGLRPASNQAAASLASKFGLADLNINIPLVSQDSFSKLREKNDIAGIVDALQNFTDVPESEITSLLQYILRLKDSAFDSIAIRTLGDVPSFFSSKKSVVLDLLLGMPYNDVFIHNSLKKLNVQETMLLLKYLHHFLEKNPIDIKDLDGSRLTVAKAIGWINLLLDSHFTEFLLTNDTSVRQILSEIYEIATSSLHLYEVMEELEQLLHIIQKKIKLPKEKHCSLYCVEVLRV